MERRSWVGSILSMLSWLRLRESILNTTEYIFVTYENYIETFELTEQFR
jgi:hypothetical protein